MTITRFPVEVQPDFIERQAKASPIAALAELIWNGLDADATCIDVRLTHGEFGLAEISVADNGHGIPFKDAPTLFSHLGGSWKKRGGHTKTKNRALHGFEGRGRFRAFALGRVVSWKVIYKNKDDEFKNYDITMIESSIQEVHISDEEPAINATQSGVEITISELHHDFHSLEPDNSTQELSEIFALYLQDYRDVSIAVEGIIIDPKEAISSIKEFQLEDIILEETRYKADLEIIEWRTVTKRALYLCNEAGFPLSQVATRFHVGNFNFSAYLKSPLIARLYEEMQLELVEMNPQLSKAIETVHLKIREYFQERSTEHARAVVEEWKSENIYPYKGEAQSQIEQVERKVFDIVAISVNDHLPDFAETPSKNKALHLRMLRSAIERSPEDLQLILREVIQLPERKQQELARLLRETSLSSIIGAAKIVADRLKFLSALESIVFDPETKGRLKERSQLHRIIADNTWIFGEEYNLSVSDMGLTEVLRQHRKLLGDEEVCIDEPVKHFSKSRGIIDLMLSRALRRHRADELEHLVVELKAPRVKIGKKEITQTEEYAISVAADSRFKTANGVTWTFWVLSDDMDRYGLFRMKENGIVEKSNNITVGIKTWAQIIQENKARLQFFQEHLEYQVDRSAALQYLKDKYESFLTGVFTEETAQEDSEELIDAN
jgi:hypothetical protein